MTKKSIADIYSEHITANPNEVIATDRVRLHLGTKAVDAVCDAIIKGYAADFTASCLSSGIDEKAAAQTVEAEMESVAAAMLAAHSQACASCDRLLECSGYVRLMSSIVVEGAGAQCGRFSAAFDKAKAEIAQKTVDQFRKA